MLERIKEHTTDLWLARTQTSAISGQGNKTCQHPLWNGVKFIGYDSHWYRCWVKETIHTKIQPNNINKDNQIEILHAWIPPIKKLHTRIPEQLQTTVSQSSEDCNLPIKANLYNINSEA